MLMMWGHAQHLPHHKELLRGSWSSERLVIKETEVAVAAEALLAYTLSESCLDVYV